LFRNFKLEICGKKALNKFRVVPFPDETQRDTLCLFLRCRAIIVFGVSRATFDAMPLIGTPPYPVIDADPSALKTVGNMNLSDWGYVAGLPAAGSMLGYLTGTASCEPSKSVANFYLEFARS
jgi:hypothetical protein